MGLLTLPGVMARFGYGLIRLPLQLVDDLVLSRALGADDPIRLAFDRALIGSDRLAARLLHDPTCALRAANLGERRTAIQLSIVRHQRCLQHETDALLARHRALFREKQLRDYRSRMSDPAPENEP
ncbi:hypothetical protein [Rhodococcus sp. DMU1]|uniref:hypothetical protein n=1 Tax=Rhodococcus sp. DMU1 TaxID=2722825 RepID=UPI00143E965A|nr:hypothetical protein [Rhodococcus sp. DMU1]QIX53938.1 hypothetical protein HFP48_30795 [Rhodococcus sp. DMU1]